MSRRPNEQVVIDRFVNHLARETGLAWHPSPDEVSTRKNSRKPDCEFTCPGRVPIVADICSLFPLGSHQGDRAKRAKFVARLRPEFQREGLGGLMIDPPPVRKEHAHPDWPRNAASRIREAVRELPVRKRVEVEGFNVERVADDPEASFLRHSTVTAYQPSEAAGRALALLLRDKHTQLDMDGHQRFLVVVNEGCRAAAADVSAGCALIDFRRYPNFDRIYFEESPADFRLVYDRDAWLAMESGGLPEGTECRALVARWIEFRLSQSWPGALGAALQLCWDLHSAEWLSERGRAMLEVEAHLFLQRSAWSTPRQMWELFRGPLPPILDHRPEARPIHVSGPG